MKLFIATPCAHEVVTSGFAVTLHHIVRDLAGRGIANDIDILSLSDIELSRNILASKMFDERSYTHLLFIDSDMSFPAELIARMIDLNEPFVGAICPKRTLDLDKIIAAARRDPVADTKSLVSTNAEYAGALAGAAKDDGMVFGVRNGFARAEYVGMAVALIERSVFDTMVDKRVVSMRPGREVLSPVPYYGFFHKLRAPDGAFWSEDASFCRRWTKQCGGEIWACVDQEIGHHGGFRYSGTYLDRLRAGLK